MNSLVRRPKRRLFRFSFLLMSMFTSFNLAQYPSILRGQNTHTLNINPFMPSANRNPYLGWQPSVGSKRNSSFSWRSCFGQTLVLSDECLEYDLDVAPLVNQSFVPDMTMIRTMLMVGKDWHGNPFPPALSKELCENIGAGGDIDDINKECVHEAKIRSLGPLNSTSVTISPSNHYGIKSEIIDDHTQVPSPKVACLIYTMADVHASRIRAIRETWAGGCDGFLAFSTLTDPRLPAISLNHEGPESYGNMWQKVRSIWKFVGKHYIHQYDWFYIGGDDLFVLPHNLKAYLASLTFKDGADPRKADYFVGRRMNALGQRMKAGRAGDYFNHGGPGYALSHSALVKFLASMDSQHCSPNASTHMEDVMIARCLRFLGISVTDTRDAKGRERFHPFPPGWHFHWKTPGPPDQGAYYHYAKEWGIMEGRDCCAPDSVSFHYIRHASLVRHLQALLYSCN